METNPGSKDPTTAAQAKAFEREDIVRGAAERQVDYFVENILQRYGVEKIEVPDILANLRWLNAHRKLTARIAGGVTITVVGAIVLMTLVTLWEGIKIAINAGVGIR